MITKKASKLEKKVDNKLNIDTTNEIYIFEVGPPLLRPGQKLVIGPFSKRYALTAMSDAMEIVREYNKRQREYFSNKK